MLSAVNIFCKFQHSIFKQCSTFPLQSNYIPKFKNKEINPRDKNEVLVPPTDNSVLSITGVPEEQREERLCRIYKPTRNTMQSGTNNTHKWKIEFDNQERWENPLMGWTSSADPFSNIEGTLEFATKEDAIYYCNKYKWKFMVEEMPVKKMIPKSYGVNFAWNRRTRTSTK